ncbi:hypothetical protein KR51_00025800 [Rubidibacter lacunae KORDI 51-2]|uniref:HEAT repeat domain-containing protein n=1 Tax=Rubidibacter lacunae KORDI 51-2 TaxID=582515 RepID=U5DJW3_9CHRO|nr:HEAT repeat domain-containing protein [Rubidibacter lacunae]ERN40869.1 hypothetical protein KR51_00025800 [Rubidibacter lacunae KORDI 51-2]
MAKSRKLADLQQLLDRVQATLPADAAVADLRRAIASKQAVAVARGAKLVAKHNLRQLAPALMAAFDPFLIDPIARDPNCLAKASIADALYRMDCREIELFLSGIRHFQLEPVFGGRQDTAPKLRSICALGLVRANYEDVFVELADLLADPEAPARTAAAQAIAYSENRERGVPLLRLRIRVGDTPTVLADCFTALLSLAPHDSLSLVAGHLDASEPEVREAAALVLGESRLPEAFELLRAWWERTFEPNLRSTALLAISMLRSKASVDFLLAFLAESAESELRGAAAALELLRPNAELWQQICTLLAARGLHPDTLSERHRR